MAQCGPPQGSSESSESSPHLQLPPSRDQSSQGRLGGGQPKVPNLTFPLEVSSGNTGTKSKEQTQGDGEKDGGREGERRGRDTDTEQTKDGDRETGRGMHTGTHREGSVGQLRSSRRQCWVGPFSWGGRDPDCAQTDRMTRV